MVVGILLDKNGKRTMANGKQSLLSKSLTSKCPSTSVRSRSRKVTWSPELSKFNCNCGGYISLKFCKKRLLLFIVKKSSINRKVWLNLLAF